MKLYNLFITASIIILCFVGCNGKSDKVTEQPFSDFVSIDEIDAAEINNNSGTISLNYQQLAKLKKELEKLTLQPGGDIKVGAIGLKFTIAKQEYFLSTRTNGKLAELTSPNGKSMVFNLNGLNLDNYKNEQISKKTNSLYVPVNTWMDDFKNFRIAVYNNDLEKLKTYFQFPFDDEGKAILSLCELTESDWEERKRKFPNPDLFYEADLAKYHKKIFEERFTKAILKIKSEELFSKHKYSTKTFVDKDVIYEMHADYNEADKTLMLNMAFGNNFKDENGEYVSEGEHNIIYQFKIIDGKKLILKRMDIAG